METLSASQVALFALLVLPGFISMRIFDLFNPSDKRPVAESLLEGLAFGVLNAFVFFPLWLVFDGPAFIDQFPVRSYIVALLALVIAPTVWGMLVHWALGWLAGNGLIPGRHKTPFDAFFSKREPCWVIVHLDSGKRVGGFFGQKSYASLYPHSGHLYLEEMWTLSETGAFVEPVEASKGMFFRSGDYHLIEIFHEGT